MYDVILFDLDGTLTDSALGITNSVAYSLKKYGIEVADRTELYKFIGPPLQESFEKYYGFSPEEAKKAVEYYREYYREKGIFENVVYEGIESLLKMLYASGKTLIVATSKPEEFAKTILKHFKLEKYFAYIAGANMDGTRTKKDEVICYALQNGNISDRSKVLMVGDREHDILGAGKAGIDSLGVLYGYGDYEELKKAGADYIAESVEDIYPVIMRILETDRLYLRELNQGDFDSLCKMLKDPEVMYAYEHGFSDEEVQEWLDRQIRRYQDYGFGLWAVIEKSSGELIGQCGLTMQDCDGKEVLEVGYLFRKDYWHQGLATEAAVSCKEYAFETLHAEEVYSIIRENNIPSQKVALRNGMTVRGKFTKHYYGMDMPHLIYSVKREEK